MSVSKRGTKFQAYITSGKERHRRTFDTKVEALRWEEEVREALALGKPLPITNSKSSSSGATWSLAEAGERTYQLCWRGGRSEEKMVFNMQRAFDYFGKKVPVSDITTEKVDDYILSLKQRNLSNATINRHLAALSKILTTASDSLHITKKPKFNRLKETSWRLRWLTEEEVATVLSTCEYLGYSDLWDAIALSVDTGIRRNELQALDKKSYRDGGLLVDGKNHDWRSIPLTHRAEEILIRRVGIVKHSPCSSFLFPRGAWWRSPWERVRGLSGLGDDVVWHTLRHTFASRLAQKGVQLSVLKDLMGHRTIQTTMQYAKISGKNTKDAIALLEQ
jgi:integrase